MVRITMVALVGVLAMGACKGPFGPNNTTFDPRTGMYVESQPADSSAGSGAIGRHPRSNRAAPSD